MEAASQKGSEIELKTFQDSKLEYNTVERMNNLVWHVETVVDAVNSPV